MPRSALSPERAIRLFIADSSSICVCNVPDTLRVRWIGWRDVEELGDGVGESLLILSIMSHLPTFSRYLYLLYWQQYEACISSYELVLEQGTAYSTCTQQIDK